MILVKLLQLIFGTGQAPDHSLANVRRNQETAAPVTQTPPANSPVAPEEKPKQPFNILLSRMIGDTAEGEKSITTHLSRALTSRPGVELKMVNQAPCAMPMGDDLTNLSSVLKVCWGWLDKVDADVVVWGELEAHTLRLRFVPRDAGGVQTLSCADSLIIPTDITGIIGNLVYAAAVASIIPHSVKQSKEQKRHLSGAIADFNDFLAQPIGLDSSQVTSTKVVGAAIALRLATQGGDMERVRQIGETLRVITEDLERDSAPVTWILTHRYLGDALLAQVEKNNAIPGLEAAAKAYAVVAEDPNAAQVLPTEWAEAKARIGRIMHKLAVGKPEPSLLRESVAAYNEALSVFNKLAFPHRWAELQNNLGQVLISYGEETGNVEAMEKAAKLFKNVLTVRSKSGSPTMWAATHNNLAAALFSYGKQKQSIPALHEAADSFRLALEVYQGLKAEKNVQMISNNLLRVERVIGIWEANPPKAIEKKTG